MSRMKLGIVGYSTRALVEAATQLGARCLAIDAFGDQDTLDLAGECHVVDDWPTGIVPIAQRVTVDAWLLAGGMENHPAIVEQLSRQAPVLGPSASELAILRQPEFWEEICRGINDLSWPGCFRSQTRQRSESQLNAGAISYDERWVVKSRSGSGGLRVSTHSAQLEDGYWQPFIPGRSIGVTFILSQRRASLIGATESLSAQQWPGPTPFIYRGSVGPIELTYRQQSAVLEMVQRVAAALPGYCGWLQADFIEDPSGKLWLLELNPRWTAGMEVLHASLPLESSPVALHLGCFDFGMPILPGICSKASTLLKAIVYAPRDVWLSQVSRQRLYAMRDWQKLPGLAIELSLSDLPTTKGTDPVLFELGTPILTLRLRKI